jgi:hypothetical protein
MDSATQLAFALERSGVPVAFLDPRDINFRTRGRPAERGAGVVGRDPSEASGGSDVGDRDARVLRLGRGLWSRPLRKRRLGPDGRISCRAPPGTLHTGQRCEWTL